MDAAHGNLLAGRLRRKRSIPLSHTPTPTGIFTFLGWPGMPAYHSLHKAPREAQYKKITPYYFGVILSS